MQRFNDPLLDSILDTSYTGADKVGLSRLQLDELESSEEMDELLDRLGNSDPDELPAPLTELLSKCLVTYVQNAHVGISGNLDRVQPTTDYWRTRMSADTLYLLVPETRAFAKKVPAEIQVETIESATRQGTITDLRLIQIFLTHLVDKKPEAPIANAVAVHAIPAFGAQILPALWPTLGPDNRTFSAASKIDIQATLKKLTEKSPDKKGKGQDKQSQVTKAVEKILEDAADGGAIGEESLPILKLALKYAPEPSFRRREAESLAKMGDAGKEAIPELIDAFERTGFTRDYHLIRHMMVLGKESEDVGETLIRALEDRDSTVRLVAAFNIGQMGEPAYKAMPMLEEMAARDLDNKVREQAMKTLDNLRYRLEPVGIDDYEDEFPEDEQSPL
ncbi:MAG: hypothetical protein R3B84_11540 [Zavarzinella sp.]